jgi:hypothetical protein
MSFLTISTSDIMMEAATFRVTGRTFPPTIATHMLLTLIWAKSSWHFCVHTKHSFQRDSALLLCCCKHVFLLVQIWEIIQIQDKYNATMACIATYRVFVMLTKVPYLQFHREASIVIWIRDFHLFNILFNFEAYVCQIFAMLMGTGLRCYITTYQDIWRWL